MYGVHNGGVDSEAPKPSQTARDKTRAEIPLKSGIWAGRKL